VKDWENLWSSLAFKLTLLHDVMECSNVNMLGCNIKDYRVKISLGFFISLSTCICSFQLLEKKLV